MPPRAKKNQAPPKEPPVSDAPIILFLKVPKDVQQSLLKKDEVQPEAFKQAVEYSEILKEEVVQQQFDESVIL